MGLELLLYVGLGLIIGSVISWLIGRNGLTIQKERNIELGKRYTLLEIEFAQERSLLETAKSENHELEKANLNLLNQMEHLREKHEDTVRKSEEMMKRFEDLANKVLDEKVQKFDVQHRKGIQDLLQPLKERIETFERRIDTNNKESIERHSSLGQHIIGLTELNNQLSKEANNLTKALKGDSKKQGNWGELILEKILEKSGLEKGREYEVQTYLKDDEGKVKKPDVVISLPDNKKLIIDSKVSLTAYEQYFGSESEIQKEAALKAHVLSLRKHINELSVKNYEQLYEVESPDFVLMFVPIDSAFALALEVQKDLYSYAYDRNVVLVTPATLLATLKTVDSMWRNDKQQRNSIEIAKEAGKMYDKLVLFMDDMQKIGTQLGTVTTTYEASMNKLASGKGNLISRGEKMRQLGAKASKRLK